MRIAVNTRLLLPGKLEGIGWFACETLKRITRANPGHEFMFLFDRPFSKEFIFSDNINPLVLPPQSRHPLLWYYWFEHSVPRLLRKLKADFYLSPDGFMPLSITIPSCIVIHDINFIHHPGYHNWLTGKYYRRYFPLFARKADRIATVSYYSKNDINQSLGISTEKIDVVYNGSSEKFIPVSSKDKEVVKNTLTGGNDYFIYAGSFHKRKNICRLLQAFDRFKRGTGYDLKLVLAGNRMHNYPEMERTFSEMSFRNEVIFAGHREQDELRMIYGAASALVYVPLFEGFGLPVLEAMNCDIPVITSNCTSLPEVAENAALLVDPSNVQSIADAMQRITEGDGIGKDLVARGRERRKVFSWDRTADLLWHSINRAADR